MVEFVFDPEKDRTNIVKHGISLARSSDIWLFKVVPDERRHYGERRYRGFGELDGEPVCLAFTVREGSVRAISLRRAHTKEMRRHGWQA